MFDKRVSCENTLLRIEQLLYRAADLKEAAAAAAATLLHLVRPGGRAG